MVDGGHPAQSNIFFAIKFWPISSQDERGSILLFLFLYSRTSLPPLGHQKYHGVCSENSFLARNLYIKLAGALSLNTLVLRHFKAEIPRDLFILGKHLIMFFIPNRFRIACKPTQMYGFRKQSFQFRQRTKPPTTEDPAKYSAGWSRGRPKNGNGLPAIPPSSVNLLCGFIRKQFMT